MSNDYTMINRLQPFMRKSKIYKAIFNAEASQLLQKEELIADLQKQLNIDTATWGLSIYEKELGIFVDNTKPLSERRSRIKAKLRGVGKVDAALIKITISSWTGGLVDVEFINSKIIIKFIDVIGIPENMSDVQAIIEEIKPAHLAVLYEFIFNTYNTLAQFTHDYLSQYTHDQLREGVI